jgi:hypothetical protein
MHPANKYIFVYKKQSQFREHNSEHNCSQVLTTGKAYMAARPGKIATGDRSSISKETLSVKGVLLLP